MKNDSGRSHPAAAPEPEVPDVFREFVDEAVRGNRDLAYRVLSVATRTVDHHETFIEGHWLLTAATEVYVSYCYGYRSARVYRLLARFIDWLARRNELRSWDRARLRWKIDEARKAHGDAPLGAPSARDWDRPRSELDGLIRNFVATSELTAYQRHMAQSSLRLLACFACGGSNLCRFGILEPPEVLGYLETEPGPGRERDRAADRSLLALGATFYLWLGQERILEPTRAESLAGELTKLALALRWPVLVA
ncbi:MAG: hypothetical protein AAGF12_07455 [Myxococcota bacterium]